MSSGSGVCVSNARAKAARAERGQSGQHNNKSLRNACTARLLKAHPQLEEIFRQNNKSSPANMQRVRKRTCGVFH